MLFNSIDFAIFLPVVFVLYWFVFKNKRKLQNAFLVLASYVFYAWWDWKFLSLIILSSLVDYSIGIALNQSKKPNNRIILLLISIFVNIGVLGIFKYFNFFAENFAESFQWFGYPIQASSLNLILPVGISFYTFQTLSYSIDVYRGKLKATTDYISFFAFVSFFPQLVAGPIERAKNLLPQFYKKRNFDYEYAMLGVIQISWGLFKKVVVADNCAFIVNQIFENYTEYSGSTLALGAVLFAFQIYGDFSGYSDMAIGTAKLFGFKLMRNFDFPYFSRDIAEFWRRWHISLSTWFRDYVYIPLGGSRGNMLIKTRNIFIIFIVSGFWHGANWTFIAWGFINACLFIPLLLTKNNRNHLQIVAQNKFVPSIKELLQIGFTFSLTCFAWVFFRAENINIAFQYLDEIFSASIFKMPYVFGIGIEKALICFSFVFVLLLVEWFNKHQSVAEGIQRQPKWLRWLLVFLLALIVFLFGVKQQDFIYFQF